MNGAAAELRADLLDGPLAPSSEAEATAAAGQITRAVQLAGRGEHAAAACEAAAQIEAGIYDIRLIGYYLFGVFLERGVAYLPVLLERFGALVTDHLAALGPARRKLQVVNSATAWLFEHVALRLQFHAKQRDATWDAWREASDAALVERIGAGCTKVALALEPVIEGPLAAAPLGRIRRWAADDLRRAVVRREAPANSTPAVASIGAAAEPSEPADLEQPAEPEEPAEPADDEHEIEHEIDHAHDLATAAPLPRRARGGVRPAPAPAAPAADELPIAGSPALTLLQAKLRGFEHLVARGELAKAAVVASDVRAILSHFDPIEYFPSLFAGYFKVLHQVVDDLAPYFDRAGDPSWDALVCYYRADMRAFLEDE